MSDDLEDLVQYYMDRYRRGLRIYCPVVVVQPDGRRKPLDDDWAKCVAAERLGFEDISAYVISTDDPAALERIKAERRNRPATGRDGMNRGVFE